MKNRSRHTTNARDPHLTGGKKKQYRKNTQVDDMDRQTYHPNDHYLGFIWGPKNPRLIEPLGLNNVESCVSILFERVDST